MVGGSEREKMKPLFLLLVFPLDLPYLVSCGLLGWRIQPDPVLSRKSVDTRNRHILPRPNPDARSMNGDRVIPVYPRAGSENGARSARPAHRGPIPTSTPNGNPAVSAKYSFREDSRKRPRLMKASNVTIVNNSTMNTSNFTDPVDADNSTVNTSNFTDPVDASSGVKLERPLNLDSVDTGDIQTAGTDSLASESPLLNSNITDDVEASANETDTTESPDSTSSGDGNAPAYNFNNVPCDEYKLLHGADKWNITDGDDVMQAFQTMFETDALFCTDCFGLPKGQCDSDDKSCSQGIRNHSIAAHGSNPRWSVAAALFAQYGKADTFTCQIGPNNGCANPPECESCVGGDGPGAAALLQSISNAYISFQTNYEAVQQAGDECDMQMDLFSSVFAPVPDKEVETILLVVLIGIVGGAAGFVSGFGGAFAGMAVGVGSGVAMERAFAVHATGVDTSSPLGNIVGAVLDVYAGVTDALFRDGRYKHLSSDGKSEIEITMSDIAGNGAMMEPDEDPKTHFTGLIPTYKKLMFQQLAMHTWLHLQVDGKKHTPFIAFDTVPCAEVDHADEKSLSKMAPLEKLEGLEVQVDFQGRCYYLLDATPLPSTEGTSHHPDCKQAHNLPGGTRNDMTEHSAAFAGLSIEDFVIPSVLAWQQHSMTNGYASAGSNGHLVTDTQEAGVVNIPVCDHVGNPENPGVGCPRLRELTDKDGQCILVPASEGKNLPGSYQQGRCRAHVTQWQKNQVKNNVNPLPNYQLSVEIYDQAGRLVGSASKQDAAKPLEVDNSALPYNLILATGGLDSDPISFWYADQYWTSKDTGEPHKCKGGEDGGDDEYDNGARRMDCGFDCPFLKAGQEDAPGSATIDHPIPATPVQAVAGETSFVNTYSKTAGPAPAEATPTYVSGVCRMKITQYQKHQKDSNPTNDFQLEISVKDSEGNQAAYLPKRVCPIGEPITMMGLKGGYFNVIVGKDLGDEPLTDYTPISFTYCGQEFDTDSLKCLQGEGGQYENGDRELDCNINC
ncbi:MAG: hypothetical protein Q9210_005916 [Variospora velana]